MASQKRGEGQAGAGGRAAHPKPSLGSSSLCRRFDRISAFPPSFGSLGGRLGSVGSPPPFPLRARPDGGDGGGDEIGAIIMRAMSRHLGHSIARFGLSSLRRPPAAHVLVRLVRPSARPPGHELQIPFPFTLSPSVAPPVAVLPALPPKSALLERESSASAAHLPFGCHVAPPQDLLYSAPSSVLLVAAASEYRAEQNFPLPHMLCGVRWNNGSCLSR